MEKYSGVFERFYQFENLYDGYRLAEKNKRFKPEVLAYSAHLEDNLIDAQNHLIYQDLVVKGIHSFYEYFPKVRLIHALPFKYRVMNCAAYNVLWPIYSKSMYEHSYGSIPGRGQIKACDQLQKWLRHVRFRPGDWHIGKMDVQKFFFRIPVDVQLRELMKPLDDLKMYWYLETMIRSDGRPFGMPLEYSDPLDVEMVSGIGMQVGSLISQMTANVVLTPVDHFDEGADGRLPKLTARLAELGGELTPEGLVLNVAFLNQNPDIARVNCAIPLPDDFTVDPKNCRVETVILTDSEEFQEMRVENPVIEIKEQEVLS